MVRSNIIRLVVACLSGIPIICGLYNFYLKFCDVDTKGIVINNTFPAFLFSSFLVVFGSFFLCLATIGFNGFISFRMYKAFMAHGLKGFVKKY